MSGARVRGARGGGPAQATLAPELPVLLFEHADDWAAWLDAHHAAAPGAWLRLARKGAGLRLLTYAEAVDAALCHGWIDSLARRHDARSWAQRFTPRGPRSRWSPANRARVGVLAAAGRMRPAGLIAAARAEGRAAGTTRGAERRPDASRDVRPGSTPER